MFLIHNYYTQIYKGRWFDMNYGQILYQARQQMLCALISHRVFCHLHISSRCQIMLCQLVNCKLHIRHNSMWWCMIDERFMTWLAFGLGSANYVVSRLLRIVSLSSCMLAFSEGLGARSLSISWWMSGRIREIELDFSVLMSTVTVLKGASTWISSSITSGSTALHSRRMSFFCENVTFVRKELITNKICGATKPFVVHSMKYQIVLSQNHNY